jgi:hypothetical protein
MLIYDPIYLADSIESKGVVLRSDPCKSNVGKLKDTTHELNLLRSLLKIVLIDTYRISPEVLAKGLPTKRIVAQNTKEGRG